MPVFSNFQQIYQKYLPELQRLARRNPRDSSLQELLTNLENLNEYYLAWMGLAKGVDKDGRQALFQVTSPRFLDNRAIKDLERRMNSVISSLENFYDDSEEATTELEILAMHFFNAVESDRDTLRRGKPDQNLQQLFRQQVRDGRPIPISEAPLGPQGAIVDHSVRVQQEALGDRDVKIYQLRLRIQQLSDFQPEQLQLLDRYDALGQLLGQENVLELYERQYAEIQGQPSPTIAFSLGTAADHNQNRKLIQLWGSQAMEKTLDAYDNSNPPQEGELINGRDPADADPGDYAMRMLGNSGQSDALLLGNLSLNNQAAHELLDIQVMDFLLGQKRELSGLELQFRNGSLGPQLYRVKTSNNAQLLPAGELDVNALGFLSPTMAETLSRLDPEQLAIRLARTGLEGDALQQAVNRLEQLKTAMGEGRLQVLETARDLPALAQQVEKTPLLSQVLLKLPQEIFLRQEGTQPEQPGPQDSQQLKPLPEVLYYQRRPDLMPNGYQMALQESLERIEKSFQDALHNSSEFTGMRNALHNLVEGKFDSLEALQEGVQTLKEAAEYYISQKSSIPRTANGRHRLQMAQDLLQAASQMQERLDEVICYRDQKEYQPKSMGLPLDQAQDPLALRLQFGKAQAEDRLFYMCADAKSQEKLVEPMTEYLFYQGLEMELKPDRNATPKNRRSREQLEQELEPKNRTEILKNRRSIVLAWMKHQNIDHNNAFILNENHGNDLYNHFRSYVLDLHERPELTARLRLHQALKDSEEEVIRALEEDPQRVAEPMARYLCLKALEANGDEKVIYHGLKQESMNASVSAMLPGVSRWLNNMGREESQPVDLQSSNLYRSFLIFQANEQKRIETSLHPTAVQSLRTILEQEEEELSDDAVIATLGIG